MKILACIAACLLSLGVFADSTTCPISLSNPDGQDLILERLDVRVAVHGCLSLTEMEMIFRNPQQRLMEGRFLCVLPPGAAVSRFAKEVNGKLMEGEVVERAVAHAIYTQILHTPRDPALLEIDQGNRFSARVYPIPANDKIRILLSYSLLAPVRNGERRVVVPLAGMPRMAEFNFSATGRCLPGESASGVVMDKVEALRAGDVDLITRNAKNFKPEKDIVLVFKADEAKPGADVVRAYQTARYQMLTYRPHIPAAPQSDTRRSWVFYIDTSASNAAVGRRRVDALYALLKQPESSGAQTWFFDCSVVKGAQAGAAGLADATADALSSRGALGATNLEAALKHLADQARAAKTPQRFVLVSDGIATAGKRELGDLLAALGSWPERHILDALVIGGTQDANRLAGIVEKTNGRAVSMRLTRDPYAMEKSAADVIAELSRPAGRTYEFRDEGAKWVYPSKFHDVQPGSELIVFAELKPGAASRPSETLRRAVTAQGAAIAGAERVLTAPPTPLLDFQPLLQREASRALLDRLEQLEEKESDPRRKEEWHNARIVVSIKNRVLCPLTSLLVLETEWDYQRFSIRRETLSDIMAIGKSGIELQMRAEGPQAELIAARRKLAEEQRARAEKQAADAEAAYKAETQRLLKELDEADRKPRDFGAPEVVATKPAPKQEAKRAEPPIAAVRPSISAQGGSSQPSGTFLDDRAPLPVLASPVAPGAGGGRDAPPQSNTQPELKDKAAGGQVGRAPRSALAAELLRAEKWDELKRHAQEWLASDPENPQVYECLGTSAAKLNDLPAAIRAYSSIAEIGPYRAELLARSGWLLLSVRQPHLAVELFAQAILYRQDDCNLYRGLALSHWAAGNAATAAIMLEQAVKIDFHIRYGNTRDVLRQELAYVLRAMLRAQPAEAARIRARAAAANVDLGATDALRVTLCWETDACDVDLFVTDPAGEVCDSQAMQTQSGLSLNSNQRQGLGPEVICTQKALPGKYPIRVRYTDPGPMGVTRGIVVVMKPLDGMVDPAKIVVLPFCLAPDCTEIQSVGAAEF